MFLSCPSHNAKGHKSLRQFERGIKCPDRMGNQQTDIISIMEKPTPLEPRPYKLRNPKLEFFCPLCRTERGFIYNSKLSWKNYFQITLITLLFFPIFGPRVFVFFLAIAAIMELILRIFLKNEIQCPHCGFDASWYKKDIKTTRKKIQEFWEKKQKLDQRVS
ncbi:MAG: hypothetical protein ACHQYQ_00935 [Bacteriovoracales bacterium]